MSDILTTINLKKTKFRGLAEWGRKSVDEMIKAARTLAIELRAEADAIDAAADDDFRVEIVRGPMIQHRLQLLQPGTGFPSPSEGEAK